MNRGMVAALMSLAGMLALLVGGCPPGGAYNPTINPADFSTTIDNPFDPLVPGTVFTYTGTLGGSVQDNVVTVTNVTKVILGVTCVEVLDVNRIDGKLEESTQDWYAQDKDGNVWYFGEAAKQFGSDGVTVVGTEGSWEAGVDGAKPGIVMEGSPKVGDTYRQEYLVDVAEDMAEVLAVDPAGSVTVRGHTYTNLVQTNDTSRLDPGVVEVKTFAAGVGLVKSEMVAGGIDQIELVSKVP
jgi:hypothetical protein